MHFETHEIVTNQLVHHETNSMRHKSLCIYFVRHKTTSVQINNNNKAVPGNWLENTGRRLDCGPYMSGAIEAKELLRKHATEPLKTLTEGHNGGIFNGSRCTFTLSSRKN